MVEYYRFYKLIELIVFPFQIIQKSDATLKFFESKMEFQQNCLKKKIPVLKMQSFKKMNATFMKRAFSAVVTKPKHNLTLNVNP